MKKQKLFDQMKRDELILTAARLHVRNRHLEAENKKLSDAMKSVAAFLLTAK